MTTTTKTDDRARFRKHLQASAQGGVLTTRSAGFHHWRGLGLTDEEARQHLIALAENGDLAPHPEQENAYLLVSQSDGPEVKAAGKAWAAEQRRKDAANARSDAARALEFAAHKLVTSAGYLASSDPAHVDRIVQANRADAASTYDETLAEIAKHLNHLLEVKV